MLNTRNEEAAMLTRQLKEIQTTLERKLKDPMTACPSQLHWRKPEDETPMIGRDIALWGANGSLSCANVGPESNEWHWKAWTHWAYINLPRTELAAAVNSPAPAPKTAILDWRYSLKESPNAGSVIAVFTPKFDGLCSAFRVKTGDVIFKLDWQYWAYIDLPVIIPLIQESPEDRAWDRFAKSKGYHPKSFPIAKEAFEAGLAAKEAQ